MKFAHSFTDADGQLVFRCADCATDRLICPSCWDGGMRAPSVCACHVMWPVQTPLAIELFGKTRFGALAAAALAKGAA